MSRLCFYLFYLFFFAAEIAFAQQKADKTDPIDIFKDPFFKNGFSIQDPEPGKIKILENIYPFGKTKSSPSWRIVQWSSKYSLAEAQKTVVKDTVVYKNAGKKISFYQKDHDTLIGLELYASREYASARKGGESWPHLLLEQQCDPVSLTAIRELWYQIEAKLLYDTCKMNQTDFNRDLHTAQFTVYLQVQNTNKTSKGYGDFFWFGLPLYDYRYPEIAAYAAQDLGKDDATQKFIYNVASKTLFHTPLQQKEWVKIHQDIYPTLIDALKHAQEKGYLSSSAIKDMAIVSANMGWEVPGTFDCALQFRAFRFQAKYHHTADQH